MSKTIVVEGQNWFRKFPVHIAEGKAVLDLMDLHELIDLLLTIQGEDLYRKVHFEGGGN